MKHFSWSVGDFILTPEDGVYMSKPEELERFPEDGVYMSKLEELERLYGLSVAYARLDAIFKELEDRKSIKPEEDL